MRTNSPFPFLFLSNNLQRLIKQINGYQISNMRNSYLPLLILLILVGCRDGELENKRNQVAEVKIGQQIWMAKNLSVKTENSWCFGNCDQTGRHYSWEGAQAAADEVTGWRLPTDQDWRKL